MLFAFEKTPRIGLSSKQVLVQYREYEYRLFQLVALDICKKVVFYLITIHFVSESLFDSIEYTYVGFFHYNINWT